MSTLNVNTLKTTDGLHTKEIANLVDSPCTGFVTSFDSVSDMQNSDSLSLGDFVETKGYDTPGDGGGNVYEVIEDATATEDGGSIIDVPSSNIKLRGLFPHGVHVEQFGAISNSVVDERSRIQSAINFAEEVIFPKNGFFLVSDALDVSCTIHGKGSSITRTDGSGFSNIILISNETGLEINDLTVDGKRATATGGFTNIQIDDSDNIVLNKVSSLRAVGHGVSLTGCSHCSVSGSTVKDSGVVGIEVRSSTDCWIKNNEVEGGKTGIELSHRDVFNERVFLTGNVVHDGAKSGISVPRDVDTEESLSLDIHVTGNIVYSQGENGYLFQCSRGTCSNNISRVNGQFSNHQGFVINGFDLTVCNNISEYNSGVGIDLGNSQTCTVADNVITGNAIIGLEINSCNSIIATGNLIKENYQTDIGIPFQAGIVVAGLGDQWPTIKSNNILVQGNIIGAGPEQTYGIFLDKSDDVVVTGNKCQSSGSVADIGTSLPDENDYKESNNFVRDGNATAASTVAFPNGARVCSISGGSGTINNITRSETVVPAKHDELVLFFSVPATLAHGTGNLNLRESVNYPVPSGAIITFRSFAGTWYEVSRSQT